MYLYRLFLACLLGVFVAASSAFAFSQGLSQRHQVEKLEVTVKDAKLERDIKLNALLIKPMVTQPWQTVVLPSNCTGQDDQFWTLMVPAFLQQGYAVVLLTASLLVVFHLSVPINFGCGKRQGLLMQLLS